MTEKRTLGVPVPGPRLVVTVEGPRELSPDTVERLRELDRFAAVSMHRAKGILVGSVPTRSATGGHT